MSPYGVTRSQWDKLVVTIYGTDRSHQSPLYAASIVSTEMAIGNEKQNIR